jgi:hypothetical protein
MKPEAEDEDVEWSNMLFKKKIYRLKIH